MKRIVLALTVLALAAPGFARADAQYTPAYDLGPQGGDSSNTFMVDPDTGEMTVIRHQLAGVTGGLGCGGSGGFANFEVAHTGIGVTKVEVAYEEAIVDPYAWINVGVRHGDHFLDSTVVKGPLVGEGTVSVEFPATDGDIVVWFGIQVSSACPNVDGGHAVFPSVTITDAGSA